MLKDKLLGVKLKEVEIEIEGEKAIVKELLAGEAAEYSNSLYKMVNGQVVLNTKDAQVKLMILTLYDLEGNRVFDLKDMASVKEMPSRIVDQVYKVSSVLNGIEKEKAKN